MDLPRGFSPPGILQGVTGDHPKLPRYLQGKSALVVGDRSLGFCFASAEGRCFRSFWSFWCWKDKTMRDFCRFWNAIDIFITIYKYIYIYIDSCLELVANHCLINKRPFQHIAFSNHVVAPGQIESKHRAGWLLLLELFGKNGSFSVKEFQYTTSFSAVSYQFFFSKGVTHLET